MRDGNEAPAGGLHVTKDAINALPLLRYEGPVRVVRDGAGLRAALEALGRETLLGFDIEARPSFRRGASYPPALLQLAGSRSVFLFQLRLLSNLGALWGILEAASVLKAGVSVADDIRKLRELQEFEPAGFVELADLSTAKGIRNNGLRGLAAVLLGGRVAKGARTTDWSRDRLSEAQVAYAATDAWASRQIYLELLRRGPAGEGSRG